jgi:hypothetical protein
MVFPIFAFPRIIFPAAPFEIAPANAYYGARQRCLFMMPTYALTNSFHQRLAGLLLPVGC